jgi:ferredoxin, 2Fe-2S
MPLTLMPGLLADTHPNPLPVAAKKCLESMINLTIKTRKGETRDIEGALGFTLMEAIRHADISELAAICGGSCSCGTCHVFVEEGPVEVKSPASEDEDALLGSSDHRRPQSRLACQVVLGESLDGLIVTIAPED